MECLFGGFVTVCLELKIATRYGAKPDFGDTFVNFQPNRQAPSFSSEANRFFGTAQGFMEERKARMTG